MELAPLGPISCFQARVNPRKTQGGCSPGEIVKMNFYVEIYDGVNFQISFQATDTLVK